MCCRSWCCCALCFYCLCSRKQAPRPPSPQASLLSPYQTPGVCNGRCRWIPWRDSHCLGPHHVFPIVLNSTLSRRYRVWRGITLSHLAPFSYIKRAMEAAAICHNPLFKTLVFPRPFILPPFHSYHHSLFYVLRSLGHRHQCARSLGS